MLFAAPKRFVAALSIIALTGGFLAVEAPAASAATTHATATTRAAARPAASAARVATPDVVPNSDSTLTALSVDSGGGRPLGPDFDSGTHLYEVTAGSDAAQASITPTPATGATAVITSGGSTFAQTSGTATVPLTRGRNDVTVTVTSEDTTSSTVYRLVIWRNAAVTSKVVRVANATPSIYGGSRLTVVLSDGQLPNDCSRNYDIGSSSTYSVNSTFDPTTGLTTDIVSIPAASPLVASSADLVLDNSCYLGGDSYVDAVTTVKNAVTYKNDYHVDRLVVPSTVTTGSEIDVYGTGVNSYSDMDYWITDSSGDSRTLPSYDWAGDGHAVARPDYAYGDPWYQGSGVRTFHVGYCPDDGDVDSACTVFASAKVNWVAPTPTDVSFAPASGPVTGGTVVRLSGRFVVSGNGQSSSVVKVGGQPVDYNAVSYAGNGGNTFADYVTGRDVISFTAPASNVTGPVPVTVTNGLGTTVARTSFTYSAKPGITSIAPATVANSGGSVITLHGTGFGTAGTPSVIINGDKSPYVTRTSDTVLTAVVPTTSSSTTGPVTVVVGSPQGGGLSAAATLDLAAPTTIPTVTKIAPTSGRATDSVTLTGTGFGPAGTVGVSIDGQWSKVTASSGTSVSFQVPATDTGGAKVLVVGASTGTLTRTNGFTVIPPDGITGVTPATVPSYATGSAAKITIDGAGFASKGTVQVGSAKAVAYTASAGGTRIAGVVVPTTAAGSVAVTVTPAGSKTPLTSNVQVTAPQFSYVGPSPYDANYGPIVAHDEAPTTGGEVLAVPVTGGSTMRVEGTGFGTGGTLKLGTTTVSTTSWSDTAITFVAPAHAAGIVALSVTPTHSSLAATRAAAANYVPVAVAPPAIARIASVQDNSHPDRNEFDPVNDTSNAFTITGSTLAGTTASKTRVVVTDGGQTFTVVPTAVTASSLTFAAPRSFTTNGWKSVQVVTDVGSDVMTDGVYYLGNGVQITESPYNGLCMKTTVAASGGAHYDPAVVTIDNNSELFGASGTVTIDGVAITPSSYGTSEVVLPMTGLDHNLTNPWGGKTIVITPTDTSKPAQSVGFTCAVTPSVQTTINGTSAARTVAAGTAYTLGATDSGFVGTPGFTAGAAPGGYEYVTATDYAAHGFDSNVHAGAPKGAGEYYVRAALGQATYAAVQYLAFQPAPVHLTITGTPITITPTSRNGSAFTYKGQLGDGSDGSSNDFAYTASNTTDPITSVVWEYRDSACTSNGWTEGLPKDVAYLSDCGGDATTVSTWDVRVKSFTMTAGGTDRSIYYQPTTPSVQVRINPKNTTITAARADKVYDGTTAATIGDLTLSGIVDGDDVSLSNASQGTFASSGAGVNKPVSLGDDLLLGGSSARDYHLVNPQPTIVGTISKAPTVLALAASTSSVLLSQNPTVTITPTVTDAGGTAVDNTAAAVVLSSRTPTICTISGTTVTARAAGVCTIAATAAASANYLAATAASDPTSTTETIDIHVFAAPQSISVVADDLTIAVGDDLSPTSQISGLFDGDDIDGLGYDYYSGSTLLNAPPTEPGTYRVVPTGGTLESDDTSKYSNPTAFHYVAGKLTITAQPPQIDLVSPGSGPVVGGTLVTVTGERLDTVTSVTIGQVTLHPGDFTVNSDGTKLTFRAPEVGRARTVDLDLVAGAISTSDAFTYIPAVPGAPRHMTATGHNGSVSVTFTPPASNGGSPVTGYQVSTDNGHTWHTVVTKAGPAGSLVAVVTGLHNGTAYPVRVRALNVAGAGPGSPASTVAASSVASAPIDLRVAGHNHSIAGTFTAVKGDVRSYQVSTDGGRTWHTVRTSSAGHGRRAFTVDGVTNGVHYPVEVRAVIGQGPGRASVSRIAVPNAPSLGTVRHHPKSEIAIPAHPNKYDGPRRYTRARDTSHNGTWAHPISKIGARQLTVGEAATLDKASLFDFNSAHLTKAGRSAVRLLAHRLRLAHAVRCEGYTDYAGPMTHEQQLSHDRAVAVCQALVADGAKVDTGAIGYGGSRPVVVGGTAVSRAANRRVVVIVTR